MNKFILSFTIMILVALPFPSAFAQDMSNSNAKSDTRIEIDDESHIIRFFIDGEESARLTKEGFSVRNSMAYGGTIRDQGEEGFTENTDNQANAGANAP